VGWESDIAALNETVRDAFGGEVPVTITQSGVPANATGIFDRAHREVDPESGASIHVTRPTLGLLLSDLPFVPQLEDQVQVDGQPHPFRVVDVQPDGQGMVVLHLHDVLPEDP
jgi:hypothetical protein